MKRLKNKTAIITGGAGDIGKKAAERFVEEGARVFLVDQNEGALKKVTESIPGQKAAYTMADVTQPDYFLFHDAIGFFCHGIKRSILNNGEDHVIYFQMGSIVFPGRTGDRTVPPDGVRPGRSAYHNQATDCYQAGYNTFSSFFIHLTPPSTTGPSGYIKWS